MSGSCQQIRELLPWLLNGTLDDDERGDVRAHLESCAGCREAWGRTIRVARWTSRHLPIEVLVDRAFGEDSSGLDPELVERHLAECPDCRADLESARRAAAVALSPSSSPGAPLAASAVRRSWALAASVVVALAAAFLGWRFGPDGGAEPRADVALVELLPESLRMRGGDEGPVVSPDRALTLVLVTDRRLEPGAYRVRLVGPAGATIWSLGGLEPAEGGSFVLHVPELPTERGDLALVLEMASDAADEGRSVGWSELERYRLRLDG